MSKSNGPDGESAPKTSHSGSTDIGLGREANEDSFLISPPLFAVADGMGGHAAGDVASQTAVDTLKREIDGPGGNEFSLVSAVESANREVFEKASADSTLSGMGTTMTALLTVDDSIEVAHVGDSRAYLLRNRSLQRLTRDHTFVERLVREGRISSEEAEHHPQRSRIERALGVGTSVQIDSDRIEALPGDRLMLCSDGLTTVLTDDEIASILLEENESSSASKRLVTEAVGAGASDNVTVVVVDLPGGRPSEKTSTDTAGASAASGGEPASAILPGGPGGPVALRGKKDGRRRRRLFIIAGAVVVLLAIALFSARVAILTSWFIGAEGNQVTVFRGVPGSFAGIEVKEKVATTDVVVEDLPEVYQRRVLEGITAEDEADAERIVDDLKDLGESPVESGQSEVPLP